MPSIIVQGKPMKFPDFINYIPMQEPKSPAYVIPKGPSTPYKHT